MNPIEQQNREQELFWKTFIQVIIWDKDTFNLHISKDYDHRYIARDYGKLWVPPCFFYAEDVFSKIPPPCIDCATSRYIGMCEKSPQTLGENARFLALSPWLGWLASRIGWNNKIARMFFHAFTEIGCFTKTTCYFVLVVLVYCCFIVVYVYCCWCLLLLMFVYCCLGPLLSWSSLSLLSLLLFPTIARCGDFWRGAVFIYRRKAQWSDGVSGCDMKRWHPDLLKQIQKTCVSYFVVI